MNKEQYPDGKLNDQDDGALRISMGIEKGKIVLHFGLPIKWFGMTAEQAIEMAEVIKAKALEVIAKRT